MSRLRAADAPLTCCWRAADALLMRRARRRICGRF